MTFKIILKEKDRVIYDVGSVPYNILFVKKIPDFERLELSQRIYDNPSVLISSRFFKLFLRLLEKMSEQNELFQEIKTFSKDNIQETNFIEQNLVKIKENAQNFKKELNEFLRENNIQEITDCTDDKKISGSYIQAYFNDDLWFEIFCYYIILKYVQKERNSFERGKDFEIILSQEISGKDFQHQIDLIIIIKDKIMLMSCKSGKVQRTELLAFAKQKDEIKVDMAIIAFFNKFTEEYDGSSQAVFIFDNIRELDYDKILTRTDELLKPMFK